MSDGPEENRPEVGGSGADLARAVLAQAKADAQRRGRADPGRGDAGRGRPAGGDRSPGRAGGPAGGSRDPQPVGAAIRRLLADRGWQTRAAVATVMARWDAVVGADVAAHSRPERFVDGELVVVADSTAWATQLRLLARPLVARLNADLGAGTVRAVRVRGPAAPSWSSGPRRVTGRGPRDTYG